MTGIISLDEMDKANETMLEILRNSFDSVTKFNPNHDELGRFTTSDGSSTTVQELSDDEFREILYNSKTVNEMFAKVAKRLGKSMKPKVAELSDDEINVYRGVPDVDRDVQRLLDGKVRFSEFQTWGQGIYVASERNMASNYGHVLTLKLDESAKLVRGELAWADVLGVTYPNNNARTRQTATSKFIDMSRIIERVTSKKMSNLSVSDMTNVYWASKGYDGFSTYGEVVLFNGDKLTINKSDIGNAVQKFNPNHDELGRFTSGGVSSAVADSIIARVKANGEELSKVSFDGDRSAAGRYAANMRWKGNTVEGTGYIGSPLDSRGNKYPKDADGKTVSDLLSLDGEKIFDEGTKSSNPQEWSLVKDLVVTGIVKGMSDVSEAEVSEASLALFGTASNLPNGFAIKIDKQKLVTHFVDQWAASSNDGQRDSLLIQEIVGKVFKLDDALAIEDMEGVYEGDRDVDEVMGDVKNMLNNPAVFKVLISFVKAQYANTQAYLKSKGIETVEVFRGAGLLSLRRQLDDYHELHGASQTKTGNSVFYSTLGNMKVWSPLRPLSSWSANRKIGDEFAGVETYYSENEGVVFKTQVPISRVFSTPITGIGCLRESELVLLGGRIDAVAGINSAATQSDVNYSTLYGERGDFA